MHKQKLPTLIDSLNKVFYSLTPIVRLPSAVRRELHGSLVVTTHATGVYQQPVKDTLAKDDTFFRGHLMPEYFAKNGYHTLGVGKITHGYPGKIAFHEYGGNFHGFGPYPPGRQRFNYFLMFHGQER